jgi:uncharacterized protein (DUF924 family)
MAETAPLPAEAREVLDFWFGTARSHLGSPRMEWFRKDPKFDADIRANFGALHERASRGELDAWSASAEPLLALVVILDQFSRNLYRNDPRAFAQDERALHFAKMAVGRRDDLGLLPVQRQFLYLPFEHSEDLGDQEKCLELFRSLEAFEETRGLTAWAEKHRVIIKRFGAFPTATRSSAASRRPRRSSS